MPSPFPGMDPFIECQRWKSFHTLFIATLHEMLVPRVRPRYVVEVEEYVYLAREEEDPDRLIEPDLALVDAADAWMAELPNSGGTALRSTTAAPSSRRWPRQSPTGCRR